MGNKIILSSFLFLVLLTASVYLVLNDNVRIDIGQTYSIFKVLENDNWVLSGQEYTKLMDGTKNMRASSRVVNSSTEGNFTTVKRFAYFKNNCTAIDTYIFDSSTNETELFPINHKIEAINCEDYTLIYEVTKLEYFGETDYEIGSSHEFGHNMKVEWADGNYYERLYKYVNRDEGKLTIKYRPTSNHFNVSVRLFDPIISEDTIFTNLIYNEAGLTSGEAIFEIYNPVDNLSIDDVFFTNYLAKGYPITSDKYFVQVEKQRNETKYADYIIEKTWIELDNITGLNVSKNSTSIVQLEDGFNIVNYTAWEKLETIPKGKHLIKYEAKWKAHIGPQSIDWFANIKLDKNKYNLPKDKFGIVESRLLKSNKWAWWNSSYDKKKPIDITETSGSSLSNYSTLIYVLYTASMNVDFSDLRFLNSTEDGELNYWIEFKNDSNYAYVWIKIPTLTASSNTTIFMYYGNVVVTSTSNFSNAFILGDDFSTDTTGSYTINGSVTYNSGTEDVTIGTEAGDETGTMTRGSYLNKGFTTDFNCNTGTGGYQAVLFYTDNNLHTNTGNGYIIGVGTGWTNMQLFSSTGNGGFSGRGANIGVDTGYTLLAATNYTLSITKVGTNLTVRLYTKSDKILRAYISVSDGSFSSGYNGFIDWNRNITIDNFVIRNYTYPEPTYVIGAEQEKDANPIISLNSPSNNTNFSVSFITFNGTVYDDVSLINVSFILDGVLNETNSSGTNNSNYLFTKTISDGSHNWTYQACDNVSQCTTAPVRYFLIDTINPNIFINSPLNQSYTTSTTLFNITGTDIHIDSCWYSLDGTGNITLENLSGNYWNATNSSMTEGSHTAQFYCNDTIGNLNDTESVTFFIDLFNPVVNILSPIETKYDYNITEINYTLVENFSDSCWYSLDNGTTNISIVSPGDNVTGITSHNGYNTWTVYCNDTSGKIGSDNITFIVQSMNLFLNELIQNLSAELNTTINISASFDVDTLYIDINHPDYGINYSSGFDNVSFQFVIDYFRETEFNDSSTSKKINYSGTEIKNIFFSAHQYNEVEGISFNISGENYPKNVQINNSNSSIIDRFYPGYLVGNNVYQNNTADSVAYKNLTYAYDSSKIIYFWMDRNNTLQNMIFNITGSDFGFNNLDEFDNYSSIDTILTTAQLDLTGVIMAKNNTKDTYTYDDFEDDSINTTLWTTTTSSSGDGSSTQTVTETGGKLVIYTDADNFDGGASRISTAYADSDILESYESENISFSIDVSTNLRYSTTLDNAYSLSDLIVKMGGTIWEEDMPAVTPVQHGIGYRTATGTLTFNLLKVNKTYWKVITNGAVTYIAGTTTRVDTYTNNITYVEISGDLRFYVKSISVYDGEDATSYMHVSGVTRELYNRSNSTVISNSIYDASGDLAKATMFALGHNGVGDSIYLYLSADNGVNWENVANGVEHSFSNTGRNLKWRVDFNLSDYTKTSDASYLSSVNISIEKGSPTNINIDFGNDGILDWERDEELNSSNSPVEVEINMSLVNLTSALSGTAYYGNNLMRVPLKITSTIGQIDVYDINLTYNPNPVYLNHSAVSTYLQNSVGFVDFPISIESINGNITFDDVRFDYKGGNDTIEVLAHNADYSVNQSLNIIVYHSNFYKLLPYTWADDIFFMPRTNSSKNVSAYGQTSTISVYNITTTNYGGNMNLSIKLNESFSCLNITWNVTGNTKPSGNKLNTTYQEIKTNLEYLNNTKIWLWADLDNCDASDQRILQPYLQVSGYCVDCIWN